MNQIVHHPKPSTPPRWPVFRTLCAVACLAALSVSGSTQDAPSAKEAATLETPTSETPILETRALVEQVVEALGGRDDWNAVKGLQLRGDYSTFSTTHPFRIVWQRPNLYRFEHFEADMAVTVGYDGRKPWWHNQLPLFAGVTWPTAPSMPYALGFEADAEFAGLPFLDAESRGHQMTSHGPGNIEGIPSHVLEIRLANQTVETWYFDLETFLPVARTARAGYVGREVDSRTFFDDYRTVGSVWVPHAMEFERGNLFAEMIVAQVELNPTLEGDLFAFPKPPLMQNLAHLEGTWDVAVSSRPLPNLPWFDSQTVSHITAKFDGRVLNEDLFLILAGRPRSLQRWLSYDRFADTFKVVQIDDLTAHPNIFSASASGDPLTVSNQESATAWGVMGQTVFERQVFELLGQDHFRVEWQHSLDGQNWAPMARFEYRRQVPAEP